MKITDLQKKQGDFRMKIDSLTLESGKIHGIIGGNGCGKTTLCKLIMGILKPDQGFVDYEGLDPGKITMTLQRRTAEGIHDTGADFCSGICYD